MPGPLSRFYLRGNVVVHDSKTQSPQEIYQAETPEEAAMLLKAVQDERQRRHKVQNNRVLIILGMTLVLVLAGLLLAAAAREIHRLDERKIHPEFPLLSLLKPARNEPVSVDVAAAPPASAAPQKPAPAAPSIQLIPDDSRLIRAASLKKATDSGRYTINLSGGRARTIYVFSDPLCPHCREIEPTLEALTRDYNVVIFPVTLVGKQSTTEAVAPVLCAAPQKRAQLWQSLFKADGVLSLSAAEADSPAQVSCTDGEHALAINDRAFDYYQLPGTPQLIADDGRDIPFSALTSDDALARFMNTPIKEPGNDHR
ncbi:TPA_asm: thioredoxin fold domain-containing protein [Salmonella enterica subsp. enterica serovar Javiana]|uniref:Thioredoxin fold domain-containing protein n=1 Tax=Salmonella enterica subsp. enterica serovar Javiana TaxID=363569 RepID=A0A736UHT0_SALET|nr:thioredoxin fold domain-containing protein [Salmonella enterica subsp. enterica serovar 9,12:-:1,5]EKR2051159.1 thioredoxin fold domain-containing protein [Salmonella enterica subsp. enterica serovar Javiana]HAE7705534.1 thioredoxin fold domain-containing protein [Salmonella enterica subsp. enterica serovar Javiana]